MILVELFRHQTLSPDLWLVSALYAPLPSQTQALAPTAFAEFARAWEQDEIPNKHSHAVERDYMEWEGLVAEKQRWLERLRRLPTSGT
jgi:hypothetical protein